MTDETLENVDDAIVDNEVTGTESESDIEGTQEPEEYTPSFTYKVKDEEREFDERLREVIRDKETEEYLRDLYTRADGLDTYKQKLSEREQALQDLEQYRTKAIQMQEGFTQLKQFRDNGDYRRLFSSVGLNDDQILEYALKLAEEQEMPEQYRQTVQEKRQYEDQLYEMQQKMREYENQLKSTQTQQYEYEVQKGLTELDSLIKKEQDLNNFLVDKGINLQEEVLQYGIATTNATGKEPSVAEAFNAVANKYRNLLPTKEQVVENIVNNRPKSLPRINSSNQTAPEETMTLEKLRAMANKIH